MDTSMSFESAIYVMMAIMLGFTLAMTALALWPKHRGQVKAISRRRVSARHRAHHSA